MFGILKILEGDWKKDTNVVVRNYKGRYEIVICCSSLFKKDDVYALDDIEHIEVLGKENVSSMATKLGYGLAGGALLGSAGLLAGVLAKGNKTKQTVLIIFNDGKSAVLVGKPDDFNKLMRFTTLNNKTPH